MFNPNFNISSKTKITPKEGIENIHVLENVIIQNGLEVSTKKEISTEGLLGALNNKVDELKTQNSTLNVQISINVSEIESLQTKISELEN